ncbi:hypothetical protein Ocin01_02425, partial [Orchesella cincta]
QVVSQDAPESLNYQEIPVLPASQKSRNGIADLLAKSRGFEVSNQNKQRVKRGFKSSITGLFSSGSKPAITQRPRSNSLPAALPSSSPIGLFNNGNKQPFTTRPRSNSLPAVLPTLPSIGSFSNHNKLPIATAGFGSTRNNQFPKQPLFGMDSSSSSSTSQALSPNLSPALSAASSRRGSFGLQDQMELLSIKPKTTSQLQKFDTWEKRPINSAGLTDNCYYCTAAGLTGRTTDTMVKRTQTTQNRFGTIDDTKDLFKSSYHPNVQSRPFTDSTSMKQYLNDRLIPGTSQGFGVAYYHPTPRSLTLNRNNGPLTGHMVGMKAWKNPDGTLGTREVDFQLPPNQRFPAQPNNNWSPPGSFHLIDLHPPKRMDQWTPPTSPSLIQVKRPADNVNQDQTPKRMRFTGFG